jgi:hypothetical protein
MGRPARMDSPIKITLSLSALCHEQMNRLVERYQKEPGRRTAMTRSEIVELAVAAMHQKTGLAKGKTRK